MDYNTDLPIYKQLINQLKMDIINNVYPAGSKIPSVRDLALKLHVNPNTLNRALLELEEQGLIITKRTTGKYITEDEKIIEATKWEYARNITNIYLDTMKNINVSTEDLIKLIKGEK